EIPQGGPPPASNAGAVPASAAPAWGSGVPMPGRAQAGRAAQPRWGPRPSKSTSESKRTPFIFPSGFDGRPRAASGRSLPSGGDHRGGARYPSSSASLAAASPRVRNSARARHLEPTRTRSFSPGAREGSAPPTRAHLNRVAYASWCIAYSGSNGAGPSFGISASIRMPRIFVDGQSFDVAANQSLLQACLGLGFDLPYFCWHAALGSVGACRQCAIKHYKDEKDEHGKLVMACMTPVE